VLTHRIPRFPCPRPLKQRYPTFKDIDAVTIAIGLLSNVGIVFAADTQLTHDGFMKSDEGKLSLTLCPVYDEQARALSKTRSLGVTGSGNAQYIKEMRRRFGVRFATLRTAEEVINPQVALQEELSKMHADHIVPFDRYAPNERPEIFMILGAQIGPKKQIWSTEKNLLVPEDNYAAVGIGASYAKILLSRFYPPAPPNLALATLIAAYVIFNVKETIDGCGKGTSIFSTTESLPSLLGGREIRALEEVFRKYARLEYDFLITAFGNLDDGAAYSGEQLALVRSELAKFLKKAKLPNPQSPTGDPSPPQPLPESPGGSSES
jgi:hypothetical protein